MVLVKRNTLTVRTARRPCETIRDGQAGGWSPPSRKRASREERAWSPASGKNGSDAELETKMWYT
jgi:hypothetical protein